MKGDGPEATETASASQPDCFRCSHGQVWMGQSRHGHYSGPGLSWKPCRLPRSNQMRVPDVVGRQLVWPRHSGVLGRVRRHPVLVSLGTVSLAIQMTLARSEKNSIVPIMSIIEIVVSVHCNYKDHLALKNQDQEFQLQRR